MQYTGGQITQDAYTRAHEVAKVDFLVADAPGGTQAGGGAESA